MVAALELSKTSVFLAFVAGARVIDGKPVYSRDVMIDIMSANFKLVHEEDVPFLIREHARKFQWGCSHGSVWKKL